MDYRIGYSRDVHRLVPGRKLFLGGIAIDFPLGLEGHSDADCVLHAVAEAIIGALGLGDLGTHFPDDNPRYADIFSGYFVERARDMLEDRRYAIANLDVTVILEKPILSPYKKRMRDNIAALLRVSPEAINIKATRNEGLDAVGKGEAIACECVALIKKKTPVKKYL